MAPSSISAGIDGLLHITDMSWGRLQHPSEVVKVGDKVKVVVLKYDPSRERVSLGMKQIMADPWTALGGELSGRRALQGQGRQRHRLRRFRRTGEGRRGADPRLRDELEQARGASLQGRQPGRPGRGPGARRRRGQPAHLARAQADRAQSVGRAGRASIRSAAWSRARSSRSPTSACSSKSNRESTAWSISPTCRGPRRFAILPRSIRRATRSRPSCSASTSRTSA